MKQTIVDLKKREKYIREITKKIEEADKIALFHHVRIDVDSISCSYGLLLAIKARYPDKEVVVCGDVDYIKKNFPKWDWIDFRHYKSELDSSYLTIIGDTSVTERVVNYDQYVKGYYRICFDHHEGTPTVDSHITWQESQLPASALQAHWLADKMEVQYTDSIASMLLFGVLSDSNNFKYSLADQDAANTFSSLLKYIDDETMQKYYLAIDLKPRSSISLYKYIYANINFDDDIVYSIFDKDVVEEYGYDVISNSISIIGSFDGYPVSAFFQYDPTTGGAQVGIRSNRYSIVEVCQYFGGGGHAQACGAPLKSISDFRAVIEKMKEVVKKQKTN